MSREDELLNAPSSDRERESRRFHRESTVAHSLDRLGGSLDNVDQKKKQKMPSSISKAKIAALCVVSGLPSVTYGILAFPRGGDNKALSWFYLADATLVNFPQYIFMPLKFADAVIAAFFNKDFVRGSLSLASGAATLIGTFPLSEDAANTVAEILALPVTGGVTWPIRTEFGGALSVTRITGTLALSTIAHEAILRPRLAKLYHKLPIERPLYGQNSYLGRFLKEENRRQTLGLLLADIKRHPKDLPEIAGGVITDDWVNSFYEKLESKDFDTGARGGCSAAKTIERAAIAFFMLTFLATVPMWLALAKDGSQSSNIYADILLALPNMIFYLWFCAIFPGDLAETVKQLYHVIHDQTGIPKVAGIATGVVQMAFLAFTFISGFGYLNVGLGEYRKNFDGLTNSSGWQPLMDVIHIMHHGNVYGDDIALDAGIVANMGAVCALMRRLFDWQKWQKDDVTRAQKENYDACVKAVSRGDYDGDLQTIIEARDQVMQQELPANDDGSVYVSVNDEPQTERKRQSDLRNNDSDARGAGFFDLQANRGPCGPGEETSLLQSSI